MMNTVCEDRMIFKVSAKPLVGIEVEILFDNKEIKKVILYKRDLVKITYMDTETEEKKTVTGRVTECNESFITIDHSIIYESNITKILISDIRDIVKNHPEPIEVE